MARVEEVDDQAWPEIRQGIERALGAHRGLGVTGSFGEWQKDVNGIACRGDSRWPA